MKCPSCFKTCNKIEVLAWNRCGRCEAYNQIAVEGTYQERLIE